MTRGDLHTIRGKSGLDMYDLNQKNASHKTARDFDDIGKDLTSTVTLILKSDSRETRGGTETLGRTLLL